MYSQLAPNSFREKSLYGVSATGELPLTFAMTAPLGDATLRYALDRIGKDEARKRVALEAFKTVYDTRKKDGKHNGPELLGLVIYEKKWKILTDLSNIEHPKKKVSARVSFTSEASPAPSASGAP